LRLDSSALLVETQDPPMLVMANDELKVVLALPDFNEPGVDELIS
jgi:hypothetical protein